MYYIIDENGFGQNGKHVVTKTIYDLNGYDKVGYDMYGFNVEGIHKESQTTYDLDGYDKNGLDQFGLNPYGFNAAGIHFVTGTTYNEDGYDQHGYTRQHFDFNGFDKDFIYFDKQSSRIPNKSYYYDGNGLDYRGYNEHGELEKDYVLAGNQNNCQHLSPRKYLLERSKKNKY